MSKVKLQTIAPTLNKRRACEDTEFGYVSAEIRDLAKRLHVLVDHNDEIINTTESLRMYEVWKSIQC